ncbi:hypothetical protein [Staphylococcus aureus]|uniref:hypothetical protein n=1 Tax=Staphylococcus aureus TaxID=1280 RepID=UPI00211366E9|nr:hypothetical protein [Staphylococcus aureus]MCQ6827902.1 hypothetical protein [Staphylococcus aureus]HDH4683522.1 hypothetical protein [Staphylococcus aureus]HDH4724166.1 hypothetical protein [Staphylococcus aureus]HDH4925946.1 hypothetical protein [Staphylococcus aureus]HDH5023955.1 hypothetical protein [Staphylococcus aureus]
MSNLNKGIKMNDKNKEVPKPFDEKLVKPPKENKISKTEVKRKSVKISLDTWEKVDDERRINKNESQISVLDNAINFYFKYKKYHNKLDEIIEFYENNKE